MRNSIIYGSIICLFTVASMQQAASQERLTVETSDTNLTIKSNDRTVLVYNLQSPPAPHGVDKVFERSGFLHPVCTPAGATVTAAFPADHEHQQGIFSAWTSTKYADREVDFWNLADRTGRVLHERVDAIHQSPSQVSVELSLLHQALVPATVDVLRDHWKLTVYATQGDYFCFDIESVQTPLTELPLTLEKYLYGGQAFRGPVSWLEKDDSYAKQHPELEVQPAIMMTSDREGRIDGNHKHVKWVAISGTAEPGTTSNVSSTANLATLAVLGHASKFRAPQAVRLHPTKPYFCFSPCVDGPFEIVKPKNYTCKYRYLVTSKAIDADWIDQQWDQWHSQGTE